MSFFSPHSSWEAALLPAKGPAVAQPGSHCTARWAQSQGRGGLSEDRNQPRVCQAARLLLSRPKRLPALSCHCRLRDLGDVLSGISCAVWWARE